MSKLHRLSGSIKESLGTSTNFDSSTQGASGLESRKDSLTNTNKLTINGEKMSEFGNNENYLQLLDDAFC